MTASIPWAAAVRSLSGTVLTRARRFSAPLLAGMLLLVGGCTGSSMLDRFPIQAGWSDTHSTTTVRSAAGSSPNYSSSGPGQILAQEIAGVPGFRPRLALIYVPPALRIHHDRQVPVLELLHGSPGGPPDWFNRADGDLQATVDAFASAHHGLAPLIVLPDINGAQHADTECVRTPGGADVERYLTHDVVAYVRARFPAVVGNQRWWIAGLSEGGYCAAMLALRHPTTYSAFGDMSGAGRPTIDHLRQAISDRILFGNDSTARLTHDVLWLLTHHRYPALRGWFACGANDIRTRRTQTAVVSAARAAGIHAVGHMRPGGHSWTIWRRALRKLLPWLWGHRAT